MRRMADLAAVLVVWALAGTAVSNRNASAIPAAAPVLEMNRFRIFKPPRLSALNLSYSKTICLAMTAANRGWSLQRQSHVILARPVIAAREPVTDDSQGTVTRS